MAAAPHWYRLLYKEYAKEFPSKANDDFLATIDELELKKQDIIPENIPTISRDGYNNI